MPFTFGAYELDEQTRELRLRGRAVELQPRVFDVLAYLVRHRDRMVGKEELLNTLWPDVMVTDASLQRAVSLIRTALREGGCADAVQTRARLGYRFCFGDPAAALAATAPANPDSAALLEREAPLEALSRAHRLALAGKGRVAFVCGEAGIGKTSLLAAFLSGMPAGTPVLRGFCDALFTPRAFGAILDLAAQLPSAAASNDVGASRDERFLRLLGAFQAVAAGTIVVIEDLHWADEATLDFVRYLARRIGGVPCLLVVTYRDEERGTARTLDRTLGELAGPEINRLRLAPLTPGAVATLAKEAGREGEGLFALTGGNPFLVRELLSSPQGSVPETVRDSMLARLARCSEPARRACEVVALLPGRAEIAVVTRVLGEVAEAVDEAVARGVIRHEAGLLSFRHELARLAVENAQAPAHARELHARILADLRAHGADDARLVHHARCAGDHAAVLALAPVAAARAAAIAAHREAAAHYAAALAFADELPPAARVELLEKHAYECYLTSQFAVAVTSAMAALALWRELGERMAQGRMLRFLSRQYWFLGDSARAEQFGAEAIELLEQLPPGRDLAMAYSNRSQLAMLKSQAEIAVDFGKKAEALARTLGDVEIESHALNNMGTARLVTGDLGGAPLLRRSLELARSHNLQEHVARAYVNLATCALRLIPVGETREHLARGLAYCEERDLDAWTTYLRAYEARLELDRGEWDRAAATAERVLKSGVASVVTRIPALTVLALVHARRGNPAAGPLLEEAMNLARPTAEAQRIGAAAAARAEAAWLNGDDAAVIREAEAGLASAVPVRYGWVVGELLFWKGRVARVTAVPSWVPKIYALSLGDDWRAAAEEFARASLPYERALMLARGNRAAVAEARQILAGLGATPALAALARA